MKGRHDSSKGKEAYEEWKGWGMASMFLVFDMGNPWVSGGQPTPTPATTHTHQPMGVGHSHGCMGHNPQWVNSHCTHGCSNRIHWLMSNTYAELSRQVLIGDQAIESIILNFYSFVLDNYILDVFVFHKPMKAPTAQTKKCTDRLRQQTVAQVR